MLLGSISTAFSSPVYVPPREVYHHIFQKISIYLPPTVDFWFGHPILSGNTGFDPYCPLQFWLLRSFPHKLFEISNNPKKLHPIMALT